jgi:hypothetical protein
MSNLLFFRSLRTRNTSDKYLPICSFIEVSFKYTVILPNTLAFALQLRKNLSQDNGRVPVGMKETEYTELNIHNNKNT